jgi:hypothetical protein
VSETIAAALCLISRNRKVGDVVVKLTLGETERVIAFVQTWPDHFPRGALDPISYARYFTPPVLALFNGTTGAPTSPGTDPVLPERSHYFDVGLDQNIPFGCS